jgi:hypothetical protein
MDPSAGFVLAIPVLFALAVLMAMLTGGRVPIASTFTRIYWVTRKDSPAAYWILMALASAMVCAFLFGIAREVWPDQIGVAVRWISSLQK